MNDNTRVEFSSGTAIVNCPSASDDVPVFVPFTSIETPGRAAPSDDATLPVTVCCANALAHDNRKMIMNPGKRFFIWNLGFRLINEVCEIRNTKDPSGEVFHSVDGCLSSM